MLPKTLTRTIQLIALLLLVSLVLLVARSLDGWVGIAVFVVVAGAVIWLWQKWKLHDYFFG
jgi:hypothetical protein